MDAFTKILFDSLAKVEVDKRAIRTAGDLDEKTRREATAAYLKYIFYTTLLEFPMPDFAAKTIIEAFENHVDWDWVSTSFLTEEGLN